MKYLITGGCGFLGSNIASKILNDDMGELFVVDNLSRVGSDENLVWLREQGLEHYYNNDITDYDSLFVLIDKIKPDVIYHFAGQVAMTTSIANPRRDFEINALGSMNVLESVRLLVPECIVVYSSTNKVYGDLEWVKFEEADTRYRTPEFPIGFPESIPLEFHSPYGCSKGSADQYVLDYSRIFGLNSAVFRHSSMYGGRQHATCDQGWIGWFCSLAIKKKQGLLSTPFDISGNGKQVRDLLYADDMVNLYLSAAENIGKIKGQAINIGGGMSNSFSLLELFSFLENEMSVDMSFKCLPPRISDQKVFVADITKAETLLGWNVKISKEDGVRKMIEWVKSNG